MRLLLDENLPIALADYFIGHHADTVTGIGLAGIRNGELLRRASGSYDVFVTMDRNLEYQQRLKSLPICVLVLRAPSNRMIHLRPLMLEALQALASASAKPGHILHIGD